MGDHLEMLRRSHLVFRVGALELYFCLPRVSSARLVRREPQSPNDVNQGSQISTTIVIDIGQLRMDLKGPQSNGIICTRFGPAVPRCGVSILCDQVTSLTPP